MKNFLSKIFRRSAQKQEAAIPVEKAIINHIAVKGDGGSGQIVFKDLVLNGPDGKRLVDYGSHTFNPGDKVMISGPAGCGKSAALAALRNAWLLGGSGEISVPAEVRFVPQEDYFPNRSLRGIISAPDPISRFTDEEVKKAMTDAGLADFIPEMDDETKRGEYWKNTLSGGQKNKVGFAGIFLHAKDVKVLIVDEITAALDAKSEAELYPRLLDRMKHGIVISVAHHSTLAPQHNVFAVVKEGKVAYGDTPPAPARHDDNAATPAVKPPAP